MTTAWAKVVKVAGFVTKASDVVIFAGLAHTAYAHTVLTYWVIIGMLVVTYIGVLGKAVGAHRQFGGLMPKPVRMYLLALAAVVQFIVASSPESPALFWGHSAFDVASILIVVGLLETAVSRTLRIYWTLGRRHG